MPVTQVFMGEYGIKRRVDGSHIFQRKAIEEETVNSALQHFWLWGSRLPQSPVIQL